MGRTHFCTRRNGTSSIEGEAVGFERVEKENDILEAEGSVSRRVENQPFIEKLFQGKQAVLV